MRFTKGESLKRAIEEWKETVETLEEPKICWLCVYDSQYEGFPCSHCPAKKYLPEEDFYTPCRMRGSPYFSWLEKPNKENAQACVDLLKKALR